MEKAARSSPEGQRALFEIDARGMIQVTPRSAEGESEGEVTNDSLGDGDEPGGAPGDAT